MVFCAAGVVQSVVMVTVVFVGKGLPKNYQVVARKRK